MTDELSHGTHRRRTPGARALTATLVVAALGVGAWAVLHRSGEPAPPAAAPSPTASASDTAPPSPTPSPTYSALTGEEITTPTGVRLIVGGDRRTLVDLDTATTTPLTFPERTGDGEAGGWINRTIGGVLLGSPEPCRQVSPAACPPWFLPDGTEVPYALPSGVYSGSANADSLWRMTYNADGTSHMRRVNLLGVAVQGEVTLPKETAFSCETAGGLLVTATYSDGQIVSHQLWDPRNPDAPARTLNVQSVVASTATRLAWVDIPMGQTIPFDAPLHLLDTSTGVDSIVASPRVGVAGTLSFSPTGRYLAAVQQGRVKDAWVLDTSTQAWSHLPGMPLNAAGTLFTTWTPDDRLVVATVNPDGGTSFSVWTPGSTRLALSAVHLATQVQSLVAR